MALKRRTRPELSDQSGQATTEYILLLSFLVAAFFLFKSAMEQLGLGQKLLKPVQTTFARTYRYGHPQGAGFDEGTPKNHPRIYTGGGDNNFRLFINPRDL